MIEARNRLRAYQAVAGLNIDVARSVKIDFTQPRPGYTKIAARLGRLEVAQIAFFNMAGGLVENGQVQYDVNGSRINYIICDFTVNGLFRNRGVGKKLFSLAVEHPRCPVFLIASPTPNTIPFRQLVKFYGHFGFRPFKQFNPNRWLLKRAGNLFNYTESNHVPQDDWSF